MTNHDPQKTVLTVSEAANRLGLAVSTLNKWRCIGGGPKFLKFGKAVRYRQSDLEDYVRASCASSTSQYGEMF